MRNDFLAARYPRSDFRLRTAHPRKRVWAVRPGRRRLPTAPRSSNPRKRQSFNLGLKQSKISSNIPLRGQHSSTFALFRPVAFLRPYARGRGVKLENWHEVDRGVAAACLIWPAIAFNSFCEGFRKMDFGLKDKVAFVAGASQGIGKATAIELEQGRRQSCHLRFG